MCISEKSPNTLVSRCYDSAYSWFGFGLKTVGESIMAHFGAKSGFYLCCSENSFEAKNCQIPIRSKVLRSSGLVLCDFGIDFCDWALLTLLPIASVRLK